MKLRIRYEQDFQDIELDEEATEQLWVSLSLENEDGLSDEERKQYIQEAFDKQFNRPEYNVYHRETRHLVNSGQILLTTFYKILERSGRHMLYIVYVNNDTLSK